MKTLNVAFWKRKKWSSVISQWVSILQAKTWEFRAVAFYSYPKFLWGCAQAPHLLKDTENNLELLIRDTGQKNLNSLREKVIMKNSKAGWFYLKQGLPPLPACFPPKSKPTATTTKAQWELMGAA